MATRREIPVIMKLYDLILWTVKHTARFPRHHRYAQNCAARVRYSGRGMTENASVTARRTGSKWRQSPRFFRRCGAEKIEQWKI